MNHWGSGGKGWEEPRFTQFEQWPCRSRLEAGAGKRGPLGNFTTSPCSQCSMAPSLFPDALHQDPTACVHSLDPPCSSGPFPLLGIRADTPQYREMRCDW